MFYKKKKSLSFLLAFLLAFSSTTVYADSFTVPVAESDYSVVTLLEGADGNLEETDRISYPISTDAITLIPVSVDGYITPEAQEIDVSQSGETEIVYNRIAYPLSVTVQDVSGNEIQPDSEGWNELEIKIGDEAYQNPVSFKWGSVMPFEIKASDGYEFVSAYEKDGDEIADLDEFVMPDHETEIIITIKEILDMEGIDEIEESVSENSEPNSVSEDVVPCDTVSEDGTISGNGTETVSDNDTEQDDNHSVSENSDLPVVSENETNPVLPVSEEEKIVELPDPVLPAEELISLSADDIGKTGESLLSLSGDGIVGNPSVAVTNTVISPNHIYDEKTKNTYLTEDVSSYTLTLVKGQKTTLMASDAWESVSKKTATVNASGKITGKKIGETDVYRYGAMPTVFHVKVVDPKTLPKKVTGYVSGDQITVGKGKSIQSALIDTWVSVDPKIVQVNKKTGQVTAKKSGTTTVSVTGTHNREYKIKVEDPDILQKNLKLTMSVGETMDVADKLLYTSLPVTYQVAKPDLAEVDVWGHVKALRTGSTKLYAIVNGKNYPFTLKITNNTVSGGMVNADTVYLLPKKSFQLSVAFKKKEKKQEVTYRLQTESANKVTKGKTVTYSDPFASVTNKGKITAIADGITYAVVTIGGVDKYVVKIVVEGDKPTFSNTVSVNVGDYYYIDPRMNQTVNWSSGNRNIATVNEFGVIRGIKKGKTKVSGKISGKTYRITVIVVNAGSETKYQPDYVLKEEVIVKDDTLNPRVVRYLDLSGQWKLRYIYNITYDLNGGVANNPSTYTSSDDFTLDNPVKQNYVFVGWTGSNGDTEEMSVSINHVTGHKHYVAHYRSGQFKILYDLNGGQVKKPNPNVYLHENDDILLQEPEKTGYIFDGWQEVKVQDGSLTGSKEGTPNKDMVIPKHSSGDKGFAAQWHPIQYDVAYKANGGELSDEAKERHSEPAAGGIDAVGDAPLEMETTTATYDEAFDLSENEYERDGYEFIGWSENLPTNVKKYDDKARIENNLSATDGDEVDMYAVWRGEVYDITYDLRGGSLERLNPAQYMYENDTFILNNPYKTGYEFLGWTGSNGATPQLEVSVSNNSTGNKSYTANWRTAVYPITYDLDGGQIPNGVSENAASYTIESDDISLSNPVRTGYIFAGWTGTDEVAPNKHVVIHHGSHGERYFKAQWIADVYTISYNLAGGSVNLQNPTQYTFENDDIVLNEPVKTGYTFAGWSGTDVPGGLSKLVTISHNSVGDRSYEAHWTPVTYLVRFDGNGGVTSQAGYMADQVVSYGHDFTLRANEYLREGHTFRGWATSPFGMRSYGDQEDITSDWASNQDEVVTIYAVWGVNSYSLSANLSSHVVSTDAGHTYSYGDLVTITAVPENGYSITGWSGDYSSDNATISFVMPAHNVDLNVTAEAKWYTIFLNANGGTCDTSLIQRRHGAYYSALPTPSKAGSKFLGWTYNIGDTTYVKSTDVFDSVSVNTLHAAWEDIAEYDYTVYHWQQQLGGINDENYVKVATDTGKAPKNVPVSPSVNSYPGFISPSVQSVTVNPNNSTVVNYYYKRVASKVTVGKGDAGIRATHGSDTYTYGQTVAIDSDLADGYSFDKYDGDKTLTTKAASFTMPAAAVNLTAHSIGKVTFDPNGESAVVTPAQKDVRAGQAYGTLPVSPAVHREGYDFLGWFTDPVSGNEVISSTIVSTTEPHTIYAHWQGRTSQYTVKHWIMKLTGISSLHNGENYDLYSSVDDTGIVGRSITPDVLEIEGFTTPDHQTVEILPNDATVVNYYYVRNKYTVSVRGTNGISETRGKGSYYFEQDVTLAAVLESGYDFDEWSGDAVAAGENTASVTFVMPARNVTLTPSAIRGKYNIRFLANGGSGTMAVQQMSCGSSAQLSDCGYTRDGYTFLGWSTTASSKDAQYANRAKVKDLADIGETVELYAVWKADAVKVLFHVERPDTHEVLSYTRWIVPGAMFGEKEELPDPGNIFDGGIQDDEHLLYAFRGWSYLGVPVTPKTISAITENDTVVTGSYAGRNEIKVILKHYKQNIGAAADNFESGYTLAETTFMTGIAGVSYTPDTIDYEGFTAPAPAEQVYPEDGTVVTWNLYYSRNRYKVTLNADEGVSILTGETGFYEYGSQIDVEAETDDNYIFTGWMVSGGSEPDYIKPRAKLTVPANNIQYVACAEKEQFYVTIVKDDGTDSTKINGTTSQYMKFPFGAEVTVQSISANGYSFKKWMAVGVSQSEDCEYSFTMPASPVTLISTTAADPFWLRLTAKEHITSVSVYDSGLTKNKVTAGSSVYVQAVPEKYYHFNGWSGTLTSDKEIFRFDMPNEDVDIWCSAQENTYKVRFNKNAKQSTAYPNQIMESTPVVGEMDLEDFTCYHGKALDACRFTREGYQFIGWAMDEGSSTVRFTDQQVISDCAERNLSDELNDIVDLYAVWEPIHYSIRFNPYETGCDNPEAASPVYYANSTAGGGHKATTSHIIDTTRMDGLQDITYDKAFTLRANLYQRAGYEFVGWSRADSINDNSYDVHVGSYNKNVPVYTDGQTLNAGLSNGNLTSTSGAVIDLYPIWKPVKVGYRLELFLQTLADPSVYPDDPKKTIYSMATDPLSSYDAQYTDQDVTVASPALTGAEVVPATNSVTMQICGDGSTAFRFNYSRNTYRVTLDLANSSHATAIFFTDDLGNPIMSGSNYATYKDLKSGEHVKVQCSPLAGYQLTGWYNAGGTKLLSSNPDTYIMNEDAPGNITLHAICGAMTLTYNVYGSYEDANGNYVTNYSTPIATGTANTDQTITVTQPAAPAYYDKAGSSTSRKTIAANPNNTCATSFVFNYSRKSYTVTVGNGSYIASAGINSAYGSTSVTGKWGSSVRLVAVENGDYTEGSWSGATAEVVGNTRYKVKHDYSFSSWKSGSTPVSYSADWTTTIPQGGATYTAYGSDSTSNTNHQTYSITGYTNSGSTSGSGKKILRIIAPSAATAVSTAPWRWSLYTKASGSVATKDGYFTDFVTVYNAKDADITNGTVNKGGPYKCKFVYATDSNQISSDRKEGYVIDRDFRYVHSSGTELARYPVWVSDSDSKVYFDERFTDVTTVGGHVDGTGPFGAIFEIEIEGGAKVWTPIQFGYYIKGTANVAPTTKSKVWYTTSSGTNEITPDYESHNGAYRLIIDATKFTFSGATPVKVPQYGWQ